MSQYQNRELDADDFLIKLDVLTERSGGIVKRLLSPYMSYPHQCMYDRRRLVRIISDIGFDAAARKAFDSGIQNIREIEREDRTVDAVIVEGTKSSPAPG